MGGRCYLFRGPPRVLADAGAGQDAHGGASLPALWHFRSCWPDCADEVRAVEDRAGHIRVLEVRVAGFLVGEARWARFLVREALGTRRRPVGGMTGCAGALWRWVFRQAGRPAWRDSSRMSEVASAITGIPRRTGGVCLGGGRIGRAKLWRDGSRRGWVAADLMPVVSAG